MVAVYLVQGERYNMSSFIKYELERTKKRAAYERLEAASAQYENAGIRERLAEIKSQYEPLNGLIDAAMSERDRLYAAAFYVVVGRLP